MNHEQKNIEIYTALVKEHGLNYKSLNWGSESSQQKRFEILSLIGDLSGKRVLDVGCGLGDFYQWLQARYDDIQYTGIDITPAMIEKANHRFANSSFLNCSIDKLPADDSYDYIFASGIFTYPGKNPEAQMFTIISQMFSRALVGLGFNSLSAWAEKKEEDEFYADPVEVIKYCAGLSKKLLFRHDYSNNDFTVYLYK